MKPKSPSARLHKIENKLKALQKRKYSVSMRLNKAHAAFARAQVTVDTLQATYAKLQSDFEKLIDEYHRAK